MVGNASLQPSVRAPPDIPCQARIHCRSALARENSVSTQLVTDTPLCHNPARRWRSGRFVPPRRTPTVGARLPANMASAPNSSLTQRHLTTQLVCWRSSRLVPPKHTPTVGARLPAKMASAPNSSLTHRHLTRSQGVGAAAALMMRYLCRARQALADVPIGSGGITSPSSVRKSAGSPDISGNPHNPRNSHPRWRRFSRHAPPWSCGNVGRAGLEAELPVSARLLG